MKTNYLNHDWSEITRDERFFCAELFHIISQNKKPFNKLLIERGIIESIHTEYEIGYEVCFYRDYIFKYGYNNNHSIKTIKGKDNNYIFPQKRTFDLCLFLKDEIIIIEAKAQQGFETNQLRSFDEDRKLIKKLLPRETKVKVIGLCSSHYSPKEVTLNYFDGIITWNEIYEVYLKLHIAMINANSLYNKKT